MDGFRSEYQAYVRTLKVWDQHAISCCKGLITTRWGAGKYMRKRLRRIFGANPFCCMMHVVTRRYDC